MNAIKTLIMKGARVFPCNEDKSPRGKWKPNGTLFTFDQVLSAPRQGLIPDTLGLMVVDVDSGGSEAVREVEAALGRAMLIHNSARSDRYHMWYRISDIQKSLKRSGKWATESGSGDIRCADGYVILYAPELLLEALSSDRGVTLTETELRKLGLAAVGTSGSGTLTGGTGYDYNPDDIDDDQWFKDEGYFGGLNESEAEQDAALAREIARRAA